jgi:thiamine-phosphate pyrophosphorylase
MRAPKCRLFLVVPRGLEPGLARDCLEAALEAGDVAALEVTGSAADQERLLDALQARAQAAGVAVLTDGEAELARRLKVDGMEIAADIEALKAARRALGDKAIVGARCGPSRHRAMEIAEAGADYVTLPAGAAAGVPDGERLIAWWTALFTVPCVAEATDDLALLRQAVADGADFVVPRAAMWASPAAARAEIEQLAAAMAERLE